MDEFAILSYEEFKNQHKVPKYFGGTCFIHHCLKPAEYEGGDARYYCGVCEEHSSIRRQYELYVREIERRRETRELWTRVIYKKEKEDAKTK